MAFAKKNLRQTILAITIMQICKEKEKGIKPFLLLQLYSISLNQEWYDSSSSLTFQDDFSYHQVRSYYALDFFGDSCYGTLFISNLVGWLFSFCLSIIWIKFSKYYLFLKEKLIVLFIPSPLPTDFSPDFDYFLFSFLFGCDTFFFLDISSLLIIV